MALAPLCQFKASAIRIDSTHLRSRPISSSPCSQPGIGDRSIFIFLALEIAIRRGAIPHRCHSPPGQIYHLGRSLIKSFMMNANCAVGTLSASICIQKSLTIWCFHHWHGWLASLGTGAQASASNRRRTSSYESTVPMLPNFRDQLGWDSATRVFT